MHYDVNNKHTGWEWLKYFNKKKENWFKRKDILITQSLVKIIKS